MSGQPSSGKICRLCGVDCSNRPRTRDSKGHYYCQPCFDKINKAAKSGEPVVARPVKARGPAPPPARVKSDEPDLLAELSDLESGSEAVDSGPICESCGAPMERGAILCTSCGFNKRIGQKLAVKIEGVAPPTSPRAAQARRAVRSGSGSLGGLSDKPFLFGVATLVVMLGLFLVGRASPGIALLMSLVSNLAGLGITIWLLVVAFREGIGHGLGCFFCPFYALYFAFAVNSDLRLKWAYAGSILASIFIVVLSWDDIMSGNYLGAGGGGAAGF
ncbi:MAG: hypothetical protein KJ057_16860 [Phycisphaerae bacterium]|nr:MAG: hypothetical protein EDS66_15320 [Planctomycetota bacterium]KAB2943349.1 MAG: hypothetical protein F9K17_11925 [Phycisphaerae bacterium]MBE7458659.1 hypothetical protein [Planctomycetia bacterium]MCK6466379.1 hypothetical protein [Phycisphaerae bacterium]MCL4720136.1 hypothetical protein [Phycisphaerae bacterium]